MWEKLAVPASSKGQCEEWDSRTVPCFARVRHFHGLVDIRASSKVGSYQQLSDGTPISVDRTASFHPNAPQTTQSACTSVKNAHLTELL